MLDDELTRAVDAGDTARVGTLIDEGADTEATNRHGVPVLAVAAIRGRPDIVRRLLGAGADPDRRFGATGTTALMVAAPEVECIHALIEGGADVNARSTDGMTALLCAIYDGDASPDAARALLEAGADPTEPNDISRLCALDLTDAAARSLFVELGFDPDERPGPRLAPDVLWEIAQEEAARLGWATPAVPVATESRYTICFEIRPETSDGWTDDELARWSAADPAGQEAIGIAVRDRRQRRAIRVDVRTGEVLTRW